MMSSQAKHWEKQRLLGNGDGGRGRWLEGDVLQPCWQRGQRPSPARHSRDAPTAGGSTVLDTHTPHTRLLLLHQSPFCPGSISGWSCTTCGEDSAQ